MIALAILFIIIIGLLWWVVQLLQNFFETYGSLGNSCFVCDRENAKQKQNTTIPYEEINKEINAIISKRLAELEQEFPASQMRKEEPEMLTTAFKQMLYSSLKLLKEVEFDSNR